MEFLYQTILATLYCGVYIFLFFLFPYFFGASKPKLAKRSLLSLAIIIALSFLAFFISYSIPSEWLGNRFLHGFGGGFLAFLMCWLVVRDTKLQITKFQFFAISFLIVTALGVGNELLEFFLQSVTGLVFAPTITDTWLDLVSNTVGALLAAACFVPCVLPVGIAAQRLGEPRPQ